MPGRLEKRSLVGLCDQPRLETNYIPVFISLFDGNWAWIIQMTDHNMHLMIKNTPDTSARAAINSFNLT